MANIRQDLRKPNVFDDNSQLFYSILKYINIWRNFIKFNNTTNRPGSTLMIQSRKK